MNKILKSSGWCSDGCQWNFCDFYRTEQIGIEQTLSKNKDGEFESRPVYGNYCDMFNGIQILRGSLHICNKIYGNNYEGYP